MYFLFLKKAERIFGYKRRKAWLVRLIKNRNGLFIEDFRAFLALYSSILKIIR